jgi:hypothetical protein
MKKETYMEAMAALEDKLLAMVKEPVQWNAFMHLGYEDVAKSVIHIINMMRALRHEYEDEKESRSVGRLLGFGKKS